MNPYRTRRIDVTLRAGETRGIAKAWDTNQRSKGFHTFCSSDEVQNRLPKLMQLRAEQRQQDALNSGRNFEEEMDLVALHKIKCELWNELSDGDKKRWAEKGREVEEEQHLSADA